jgi:glutamate-1-semialdehyde 2,1-aminomutase
MSGSRSEELFARAQLVTPGGVNSPVRAFNSVGGHPFFVAGGRGSHITDVDGRTYLDYVQSWGASILGHANPGILSAIANAAKRGTTFGAPTESEVLLAEEIAEAVPAAEMVRLVSSGTEAAMTVIRLARGVTGRDKIVKFAGCYHGHSDGLLAAGGSGVATLGVPDSAGVPAGFVASTIVAPYNVVPQLSSEIACVIVEPVAANMGLVAPVPGFLEGLRAECDRVGALLIFDEVITGFRLGRAGATARFGVTADLYCFGKVIGGGLPLAALAGRREIMSELAPTGPIYQAGTLSGNPLATAAGRAALGQLTPERYFDLEERVTKLGDGIRDAVSAAGVSVQIPQVGTILGIFFHDSVVENYDDARESGSNGRYSVFFNEMLQRGISLAPSAYEVVFTSLAHTDAEVIRTIDAAGEAAEVVANSMGR